MSKYITYKGYSIDKIRNDFGYYEAISLNDCDADVIYAKSIKEAKIEIDEYYV